MFDKRIWIALAITLIIDTGLRIWASYRLPWLASILLYLVLYAIVSAILSTRDTRTKVEAHEAPTLPTSGPIGHYGQSGLVLTFTASGLLSLFNPFQLWQIILQAVGNVRLTQEQEKRQIDAATYANRVRYRLPFDGEWYVYNGGVDSATSHSWDVLTQRYAYDFVMVDESLGRHRGRGTDLQDYYCYDQPILAAADGEVVKVVDGVRNAPFVGYGIADFLARSFVGNYVVVKHAEDEYSFYAHLIPGRISVRVGEHVTQGQLIGRCGHSGHSSEPHLHFHLQNRPNFFFALGLPIEFENLTVDGEPIEKATIKAGQKVSHNAHLLGVT